MKTADAHNKDLTGRVETLASKVGKTIGQLAVEIVTAERERITKAVQEGINRYEQESLEYNQESAQWAECACAIEALTSVLSIINQDKP